MRIRKTRSRTAPVPVVLSTEDTLTVHISVDVLGRELHTDRQAAIGRACRVAWDLVHAQLDAVTTEATGY